MILDDDIEILFDKGIIIITPFSSDPGETDLETPKSRHILYPNSQECLLSPSFINQ